ncbi:MAG: hypothetical protein JNN03_21985 [Rubrivivax sp.]|nr:hypothetical protein [Rubrivivax sp.]
MIAMLSSAAWGGEPPDRDGLTCTVTKQALADGLRLEVTFANQTSEPIALPPGPHLVLYRDAAATEPMEVTARIDRLQRTPLPVPAQGRVTGLYGMTPQHTEELMCNVGKPAAAGLYFYQFSRRPTFRCLLREVALANLPMKPDCAAGAAPRQRPAPSPTSTKGAQKIG